MENTDYPANLDAEPLVTFTMVRDAPGSHTSFGLPVLIKFYVGTNIRTNEEVAIKLVRISNAHSEPQ